LGGVNSRQKPGIAGLYFFLFFPIMQCETGIVAA
jgi:hypothetical protein